MVPYNQKHRTIHHGQRQNAHYVDRIWEDCVCIKWISTSWHRLAGVHGHLAALTECQTSRVLTPCSPTRIFIDFVPPRVAKWPKAELFSIWPSLSVFTAGSHQTPPLHEWLDLVTWLCFGRQVSHHSRLACDRDDELLPSNLQPWSLFWLLASKFISDRLKPHASSFPLSCKSRADLVNNGKVSRARMLPSRYPTFGGVDYREAPDKDSIRPSRYADIGGEDHRKARERIHYRH